MIGLPGTGIGGLFYLVITLFMPVHALWMTARGIPPRHPWSQILRQSGFALGIIAGMWAMGWALAQFFIAFDAVLPDCLRLARLHMDAQTKNIMTVVGVVMSFGTLSCVSLGVLVLRHTVRRAARLEPAPAPAPMAE